MKISSLVFLAQAYTVLGFTPMTRIRVSGPSLLKATLNLATPPPASPENVIILEDAEAVSKFVSSFSN